MDYGSSFSYKSHDVEIELSTPGLNTRSYYLEATMKGPATTTREEQTKYIGPHGAHREPHGDEVALKDRDGDRRVYEVVRHQKYQVKVKRRFGRSPTYREIEQARKELESLAKEKITEEIDAEVRDEWVKDHE